MATLLLTTRNAPAGSGADRTEYPSLREWLGNDWTILFSHPDDFVRCDLEMDRWLAVVQRAFAGCRIRPIALGPQTRGGRDSWVTQVSRDAGSVLLEEPAREEATETDLRTRALHRAIRALHSRRFVMVIDSNLNPRRTFAYSSLADVPSPLELLGWADATRTRHSRAGLAPDSASSHPVHPSAFRHHKHRPGSAACRRPAPGVAFAAHA